MIETGRAIRVRILTPISLGGGHDVYPGDEVTIPAERARYMVLAGDAQLIPPTDEERVGWDRQHGLLAPAEVIEPSTQEVSGTKTM